MQTVKFIKFGNLTIIISRFLSKICVCLWDLWFKRANWISRVFEKRFLPVWVKLDPPVLMPRYWGFIQLWSSIALYRVVLGIVAKEDFCTPPSSKILQKIGANSYDIHKPSRVRRNQNFSFSIVKSSKKWWFYLKK